MPDSHARVVVVDDEPGVVFLLRVVLERAGFLVAHASNGGAALVCIAAESTQLVITDRMMPEMNGSMLIARLRDDPTTAEIPIVMLSSNPDLEADADEILLKPFNPDDLVQVARRLTSSSYVKQGHPRE